MAESSIRSTVGSRRFERFSAGRPPVVGIEGDDTVRLVNMSAMGMCLECEQFVEPGRNFAIKLPDLCGTKLDGNVRWTVESRCSDGASPRRYRVGLDLSAAADAKAVEILEFIADSLIPGCYEPRAILVVDDDLACRLSVAAALTDLGHQVVAVESGREALCALEKRKFDVVLMDCEMPHLDGFQTTRRIRHAQAPYRAVPVVALTSLGSVPNRKRCIASGMSDFVPKPASPAVLETLVDCWSSPASGDGT